MPCTAPNVTVRVPGLTRNRKPARKFLGSALTFFGMKKATARTSQDVKLIPCQQCMSCRLDKSLDWALRLTYEQRFWETSSFVTLTYDETNVPTSISGPRLTTFIKDLRRRLDYRDLGKIKFFGIGEYGDRKGRPHYHAIIYGGPFAYSPECQTEPSRSGGLQWTSPHIEAVWPEGRHRISEVTFESAAYVARYALKKIKGASASAHYGEKLPEFMRCSNGLGGLHFEQWKTDLYPAGTVIKDGREIQAPKYFDRLIEKQNPELWEQTKKEREKTQKIFETVEDYIRYSKRKLDEGRVKGLIAKQQLKREIE